MTTSVAVELLQNGNLADELTRIADRDPDRLYAVEGDRRLTVADLATEVDRIADVLDAAKILPGARVGVALPNTTLHIAVVFAIARQQALWVPLNPALKGAPLEHVLQDSGITYLVAEENSGIVTAATDEHELGSGSPLSDEEEATISLWRLTDVDERGPVPDTSLVLYTSGTTGPPKGVRVSQTMLWASAVAAVKVTDPRPGDVLYLWEPIFHIGGAQTLLMPLCSDVSLALARRFSASRFWEDVCRTGATHVHYLGGILQILLQRPPSDLERQHRVRVAWGAGATPAVWEACRRRFGVDIHECYGMTETSSIVTVNRTGPQDGVGQPLPWFEVRAGTEPGEVGEICVRTDTPGLLTVGYLGNEAATTAARDGEWFRTGDSGTFDASGNLHFHGRLSDSVRIRGENVSAWQVEDVYARHPDVERCAVVGVDAEIGEQEMLLVLTVTDGAQVNPAAIVRWGERQLARYQIPRYVKVIEEMPLTPSQRVSKHRLPRNLSSAIDCSSERRSSP